MAIRSRIRPPHLGFMSQFVIVLLVVALMGAMAIEPARQLLEQKDRVASMKRNLDQVQASNASLRDRIRRLDDPDFLEQRAREQIGLARPGEKVYTVLPPSRKEQKARQKAKARKQRKAEPKTTAPTEDPGFLESLVDFIGL